MKLLDLLFGKWVKLGPLPLPVYALYVFIPSILYVLAHVLEWNESPFKIGIIIGLILGFFGMVYQLIVHSKN